MMNRIAVLPVQTNDGTTLELDGTPRAGPGRDRFRLIPLFSPTEPHAAARLAKYKQSPTRSNSPHRQK
jgi:hypothetical protein